MISIIPVEGIPEVRAGDDIAALIATRASLRQGDVVVVTQKIVSKSEGRVVPIDATCFAQQRRELIEQETARVVASRGDILIVQTHTGLVCANAGVDASNVAEGTVALLPVDPDASAAHIRQTLHEYTGVSVAVVVSDTFGRAWRTGQTNVAIGVAGMSPIRDHVGETDSFGNVLHVTQIAVADEIAGAAEMVMGKSDGIPVAIVRGAGVSGEGTARMLVRDADTDLFRTGVIEPGR
ncbi:MAG: hypothetical protein NVSMB57_01820 [Actinomycetota bacterium]